SQPHALLMSALPCESPNQLCNGFRPPTRWLWEPDELKQFGACVANSVASVLKIEKDKRMPIQGPPAISWTTKGALLTFSPTSKFPTANIRHDAPLEYWCDEDQRWHQYIGDWSNEIQLTEPNKTITRVRYAGGDDPKPLGSFLDKDGKPEGSIP